jgi:hypothetical protein
MLVWEFLDKLDNANCWVNGLNNKPAHMDSYMTCPVYENIYKVLEQQKNNYTLKQWKEIIEECEYQGYLSPNSTILARIIKREVLKEAE